MNCFDTDPMSNTVRGVINLDGPRSYEVTKEDGEVRVSVAHDGSSKFAAWHTGSPRPEARDDAPSAAPAAGDPAAEQRLADNTPRSESPRSERSDDRRRTVVQQSQQRPQQPRITVT